MPSSSTHKTPSAEPLLDEFSDTLWLEDGLARNTLDSYRRDLSQFAAWLQRTRDAGLLEAAHADLLGYLAHRFRGRGEPYDDLLSSLKRFYQFAVRQGKLAPAPLSISTRPSSRAACPKASLNRTWSGYWRAPVETAGAARQPCWRSSMPAGCVPS